MSGASNIVQFVEEFQVTLDTGREARVLVEECCQCDLFDVVKTCGRLPEEVARPICKDILTGMHQLHSRHIAHLVC